MDDGAFIFPGEEQKTTTAPAVGDAPAPAVETPKPYVDPAGLPSEGRALLNVIAGDESPGYDVMYGGRRFRGYGDHPRVANPIESGPNAGRTSSAAGRYQFLADTWDEVAGELGLKDFTPVSQDKGAWHLAQKAYRAKTGGDLLEALKAGKIAEVSAALSGTWTSLPGGIEQGKQARTVAQRYAAALQNPEGPPPVLFPDDALLSGYRTTDPVEKRYTFGDAAVAAFKTETTIGILADYMARPVFKPEPFTWTPELIKEKLGAFDKSTQDWIQDTAVSPAHIDFLTNKATERLDADKALANQGFLGASAAVLGAGLVDLPAWAAGGLAGKALMGARGLSAASRVGKIAETGAVFGASAVPLEAAKYSLDHGHTLGDAAQGVAMAALFGGGFGAMGEIGGAYSKRFKRFLDADNKAPLLDDAVLTEKRAEYAAAAGAEVARPEAPQIAPTRMDRFANWLGGWADFSVGGKLYHSKNDLISELAPKLTTIASQDITKGARDVEGALDFVNRNSAAFNARVETAMRQFYEPWAKEQGLSAWARANRQGEFFELAQRFHTDPNWQEAVDVNQHVKGFVTKMRDLFADHIEMAKSYGLEGAKNLKPDDLYLPRYVNRAAWRAKRLQHGIDGIEDVVAQAIKRGDPQLASRVGSRVVGRAATKDAETALKGTMSVDPETGKKSLTPNAERAAVAEQRNAETNTLVGSKEAQAKRDLSAIESKRHTDRASAEVDRKDKIAAQRAEHEDTVDPNSPISLAGMRDSIEQEIAYWEAIERDTRAAAKALPEAATKERARLVKEADDLRSFHQSLTDQAAYAWEEAMVAQGSVLKQEELAANTEARIRGRSIDKEAQRSSKAVREERDAATKAMRGGGENIKAGDITELKVRYWLEAFNKRMATFEDKFVRRVARKYVETVDQAIEGVHPDIDRALSVRDTALLRDALRAQGVVVDEATADAIAEMIAPRSQRGPTNLRRRTTLDENSVFTPAGADPKDGFSMRDLMESDYEKIVDRYTRSMSPHYIMAKHGFQSESAARKYVADVTAQHKGIDGYNDSNAYRDRKRANYLLDMIYGKDPLKDVDPKWRGRAQVVSNLSYARVGGSFGMAQTYDSAELILRHGWEGFKRGIPAWDEIVQTIKHGGPKADALVRDLQVFAGLGVKGLEAKVVPKFRGLDDVLADDLTGNLLKKAMRASKGLSNAVGHISALNTLTDVQHVASARIFLQTVVDVSRGVRIIEPRLLHDYGLSPENLQKFGALLQHAKLDSNGIIEDLNSAMLRKIDLRTFDELMGLTRREAFRTIIEPHAGLLPMLAGSSLFGKFAAQLKSFAAVSNAVHSVGNWRLGPAYMAKSLIGGTAWAASLYTMWTYARSLGRGPEEREKYLEKAFEPSKMAFNVWNRVGMAGITPEILGTGLAVGQKFGLIDNDEGNNYGQAARASGLVSGGLKSIPVVDMFGSLLDTLQTGVDVAKTGRGMTRYEARRLASLFPLQNAFGVSQAINAVTTNLPEKKQ